MCDGNLNNLIVLNFLFLLPRCVPCFITPLFSLSQGASSTPWLVVALVLLGALGAVVYLKKFRGAAQSKFMGGG
jgi:hypothetical protein